MITRRVRAACADEVLEGHLRKYAELAQSDRTRILAAVVRNYARSVDHSDPDRFALWQTASNELTRPLTSELVESRARRLAIRGGRRREFGGRSLLSSIGDAIQRAPVTAEHHLRVALDLHDRGVAPVLTYAFNRWFDSTVEPQVAGRRLAELTIMGLYRLAGEQKPRSNAEVLASGAAADVIHTGAGVCKHPRNLAAREVLLPLEFINYKILAQTALRNRIPGNADFTPDTATLRRDYVHGVSGESMLAAGTLPNSQQRADLRSMHGDLLRELPENELSLDLHPGNFVWDHRHGRWVLVDLGPIPVIGSEEYATADFTAYYSHTWLNRLSRERAEPIRSIDYRVGASSDSTPNLGLEPESQ
ncbi:hypothetical protein ACIO52_02825 [Nocardia sp. NPDC087230]|uniref:hypothetical protein n=1 Tax=Nocardia sp. NPDC087230 TaxID=3364331 RepID=UPI0038307FCE